MLDTEMDHHLGRRGDTNPNPSDQAIGDEISTPSPAAQAKGRNRRNGHSHKRVKGEMGELKLEIPRDKHATFQPRLIPKHQRQIESFDEKILALYAKGMTTSRTSSGNSTAWKPRLR